VFDKLILELH